MNPPPVPRRNPVASFFIGIWDVMNFTRRLILNLLFFGLLFLILIGFMLFAIVIASLVHSVRRQKWLWLRVD